MHNPISVPEGYFQDLQQRLGAIPAAVGQQRTPVLRRVLPYLTLAACFLVAVFAGNFLLGKAARSKRISDEDIVSYLITSGTSVEQLAYLQYEEDL